MKIKIIRIVSVEEAEVNLLLFYYFYVRREDHLCGIISSK